MLSRMYSLQCPTELPKIALVAGALSPYALLSLGGGFELQHLQVCPFDAFGDRIHKICSPKNGDG